MRASLSWMAELLGRSLTSLPPARELAETLTAAGLEVESWRRSTAQLAWSWARFSRTLRTRKPRSFR